VPLLKGQLAAVLAVRDDPARIVSAVPGELVIPLAEDARAHGVLDGLPVLVGDVEADVLLTPQTKADSLLDELRREACRERRLSHGTVLELQVLGDRERGR